MVFIKILFKITLYRSKTIINTVIISFSLIRKFETSHGFGTQKKKPGIHATARFDYSSFSLFLNNLFEAFLGSSSTKNTFLGNLYLANCVARKANISSFVISECKTT